MTGVVPRRGSNAGAVSVVIEGRGDRPTVAVHGWAEDRAPSIASSDPAGARVRVSDGIIVVGRISVGSDRTTNGVLALLRRSARTRDWRALRALDGEYTVWFVDGERGEISVLRDLCGTRASYMSESGDAIHLSSTLADAVRSAGSAIRVSEPLLLGFLIRGAVHHVDETLFLGAKSCPPAALTRVSADGVETTAIVSGEELGPDHTSPRQQLRRTVRELLDESVRRRTDEIATAGVALSGGLDSSTLATVARGVRPVTVGAGLRLIGLTLENKRVPTEVEFAASLARSLGAEHRVLRYEGADFWRAFPRIQELSEWPMHTIGVYHHWKTAEEAAAAGCQTLFDGNGADALFFGGRRAFYTHVYGSLRSGRVIDGMRAAYGYWRNYGRTVRKDVFKYMRKTDHVGSGRTMWDLLTREWREGVGRNLARQGFIADLRATVLEHVVRGPAFSNGTMSGDQHGVAVSFPFCSPELFEYCVRLPAKERFAGSLPKSLLREAIEDLPPEIRWSNVKAGSNDADSRGTLRAAGPELMEGVLASDSLLAPYLDREIIRAEMAAWWKVEPSISSIDVFRLVSADAFLRSVRERASAARS